MTPVSRYAASSRWLHWITVLLLLAIIPLGIWIAFFEPADENFKMRLYNLHESLGVLVFVLVLVRVVNRHLNPPPPLPIEMPGWMRMAAHANHIALYAMLLLMPLTGFLATNAWGFPLSWFGVLPIPSPLGKNEEIAKALSFLHGCGAIAIGVLIVAHLAGVVHHVMIRRDGVLRRML
ncbi:cytochrome b/b6 domain-containing protein [Variovorax sp. J22P168]|uniref:cytochrome b n=1 Tax=Variovorax jilinensis TaxID=3053513 RepID=UPI002576461C|nr:cytochrome b/b6 domain-containing protein [Variovorax sp. J22P168]MDM0012088.1 cytochrome b/b6 domain-containing protein [Variovorax sp. J22P168]